ncbi:hypothetical protein DOY81_013944, partial [Sarcophaga bullata]
YNSIKTFIQGGNTTMPLGPTDAHDCCCSIGSFNIDVNESSLGSKDTLCLQYDSEGKGAQQYRGMTHALAQIYKEKALEAYI